MKPKIVKPVHFGEQVEVEIGSMAFGGDAVGRYKDFAIFVARALPGERVLVRITSVKDQYAVGEVVSVLRPAPDRVNPSCAIFEECGGCQWQHFSYPGQLQTKAQFVRDSFQRIGKLTDVTVQPCLPSPNPYAYRNKAMPVLSMRDGRFVSGIYEPRSHKLVPYTTCPIQGDPINALIQRTLAKVDLSGLTPYQEKKHVGFLRHLAIRHGVKTGELLLAFVTRTEEPDQLLKKPGHLEEAPGEILPRIARELMAEVPGLVGVVQNLNPSRTNIVFGSQTKVLVGRDHYFEILDGLKLKVSLQSFLQVNTGQADNLHAIVREALGDPLHKKRWGTVLDLYSGIGTLALAVAEKADYVLGIEEIAPAVEDAKQNAAANHRKGLDFVAGDVPEVLLDLRTKGLVQVDAVLLDPPRKGVSPEVLARVAALHPERLVYVSCDPSTLARDLALLTKHGYAIDWAQPLDMFPQTYHVETVVRLTRNAPLPSDVVALPHGAETASFRLSQTPETKGPAPASKSPLPSGESLAAGFEGLGRSLALIFSSLGVLLIQTSVALGRGTSKAARDSFQAARAKVLDLKRTIEAARRAKEENPPLPPQVEAPSSEPTLHRVTEMAARLKEKARAAIDSVPRPTLPSMKLPKVEIPKPGLPELKLSKVQFPKPKVTLPELKVPKAPSFKFILPKFSIPFLKWRMKPLDFSTVPWPSRAVARWALIVVLVIGGSYVAKATLGPLLKRTAASVGVVTQMVPDVSVVMPRRPFLRYEMVPFEVKITPDERVDISGVHASAQVMYQGDAVTMAGGRTKLNLKKDREARKLTGNWPIPYNPRPGTYLAELTVASPQWETPKVFRSAFTIRPLKPQGLYSGYAALTMEGGKQLINGAVPALNGVDSARAQNAIDWARFMGANMFCFLEAQTSVWDHLKKDDFPFSKGDREVAHKYARAAHDADMKFAGYMTTFKVVGDAWEQAPYQFSMGYDYEKDAVVPTRFISLNDPKRRQDVIDLLQTLDKDPLVDMVGMDYVRTGLAGYEMVDEFMRDLDVPAPENYGVLNKEQRMLWLAHAVQKNKDHEVVALFEWWRAHKVALTLKSILDEANMNKPVFTFTLGWQQGHQHGQDPAMFVDAGVNYNHIMLYESDRETLKSMRKQWPAYLSRCNGMYAMGEMIDFNWVQKSLDPAGPEELYDREVGTFRDWFDENAALGMFWHDLYRMIYGIRGPYSTMEWAIAGGKAFSVMQEAEGNTPLQVVLSPPKEVQAGTSVPLRVDVINRSNKDLKDLYLHQLDTTKDYYADLATVGPFELPAGHTLRVKGLTFSIPKEEHPERDNRYMTAVMVEQADQPLHIFDFAYVKRLGARSVRGTGGSKNEATEHPEGTEDSDVLGTAPAPKPSREKKKEKERSEDDAAEGTSSPNDTQEVPTSTP